MYRVESPLVPILNLQLSSILEVSLTQRLITNFQLFFTVTPHKSKGSREFLLHQFRDEILQF